LVNRGIAIAIATPSTLLSLLLLPGRELLVAPLIQPKILRTKQ
jgi:hypothetical protein